MQESDAIQIVCYMVLEYSGACVLHGTNKFWNYRDTTTSVTEYADKEAITVTLIAAKTYLKRSLWKQVLEYHLTSST